MIAIGTDWWFPVNYAVHGRETDALFRWFFWITIFVFVSVELLLVIFLLKYRRRAGHTRATHISGNKKIEVIWTLIPALILGSLAYGSERVWKDYRSSPNLEDPQRSEILIIGQQFKWNVIYPGPDGKFGRYLVYPKPTDATWPVDADGKVKKIAGVIGPASLPHAEAMTAIANYINSENPLGKDFSDPDGKDDQWSKFPGGKVYVPVNRPVEVQLESKDVIHDFFLPNFRAQLYAVPGMTNRFVFTPTITTKDLEAASKRSMGIDELISLVNGPEYDPVTIDIDPDSAGAKHDRFGWRYTDAQKKTIVRDGTPLAAEENHHEKADPDRPSVTEKLKAAGITRVNIHKPSPFEIACAQLCGNQHYTMRGEMVVLSQEEFDRDHPAWPHVRNAK